MAAETSIPLDRRTAIQGRVGRHRRRPPHGGRWLIVLATVAFIAIAILQAFHAAGATATGFATWRPVLYAYVLWSIALGAGLMLSRGEAGHRALFVLPAVLFILAMAIFPTLFGFYIAFTDWNLSSLERPQVQRPRQSRHAHPRPVLLERARQHGLLRAGDRRRICDRLRAGAAAQPGDPGATGSSASCS